MQMSLVLLHKLAGYNCTTPFRTNEFMLTSKKSLTLVTIHWSEGALVHLLKLSMNLVRKKITHLPGLGLCTEPTELKLQPAFKLCSPCTLTCSCFGYDWWDYIDPGSSCEKSWKRHVHAPVTPVTKFELVGYPFGLVNCPP